MSSFGDNFFYLVATCMEIILIDFYCARIHCLSIMNKNSNVPKICLEFPGHQRVKHRQEYCKADTQLFTYNSSQL